MQSRVVASGAITSAEYDQHSGSLDILFGNGETFRYYGVPPDVYRGLMTSTSPMAYFEAAIEGRYSFTRTTR